MISQRDSFLEELFTKAKNDKDIMLLSADMGAQSLDKWKLELPEQFIATGISEQNTINVAAGLSNEGKKVFVYMMASWFARCFEQVRYSCAMANLPITFLGNGVALGYAPSGPAHEPNEDLALARTLLGIEIYSPCNSEAASQLVQTCLNKNKLRYIRFERSYPNELNNFTNLDNNFNVLFESKINEHKYLTIISSGYMLKRALDLSKKFQNKYNVRVLDLPRLKPFDKNLLDYLKESDKIITLEEQTLDGGFGSAICEFVCDNNLNLSIKRFGLPDFYIFENGTRDQLLDKYKLDADSLYDRYVNLQ